MNPTMRIAVAAEALLLLLPISVSAGVKTFIVVIDSACQVDLGTQLRKASKRNNDKVEWKVENKCPTPQRLMLSADGADPLVAASCQGTVVKYNDAFEIGPAGTDTSSGRVKCDVDWNVLAGNEACTPDDTCPEFYFNVEILADDAVAKSRAPTRRGAVMADCIAAGIPAEKCVYELELEVVP